MSVNLNVNGISYVYPEPGDTNWGQSTTQWAQAITSGVLQKAGGNFVLTADANFGGVYGLVSAYYKSRSSNIAQSGILRLANADTIAFRNTSNTADLVLAINGSNELTFQGVAINPISVSDTSTVDLTISSGLITADIVTGSITNAMVNASAAIAYSKLNLSTSILNSDINASAGIGYAKLAALNNSIVPVSNSSGFITSSSVTATELGYVSGVTSALQTQLNNRLSLSGGTLTGNLILNADPVANLGAATKQYVDAVSQGLQVKTPVAVATTANITLSGEQTIDGVLTSASRVLVKNQSTLTQNGVYVSAAGAWSRSTDLDLWSELVQAYVFVNGGTTQAFSGWFCNAAPGGTIGADDITFSQFSQAGQITTDSQGLTISGTQISLVLDGSTLSKSGTGLKVNEIANAQIASAAAIAVNKLAAITASRAVVSDASGFITASSVTSTELGYVSGVSSAIQTQINSKLPTTITTTGDLIYSSSGTTASRLPIGSTGQVLTVAAGIPSWSTPSTNPTIVSLAGNVVLTSADSNKVYLVNTGAARSITLPTPAAGLNFIIKDSTGQAATNNISLIRAGSESIEGLAATKHLQTNWGCFHIISDGTNWFIIN